MGPDLYLELCTDYVQHNIYLLRTIYTIKPSRHCKQKRFECISRISRFGTPKRLKAGEALIWNKKKKEH